MDSFHQYGHITSNTENGSTKAALNWIKLICQVTISVTTIAGNLLVITAIVLVKVLRQQPKNYMILSLAIADLLVGALVVPFKIALTENNEVWEAGSHACYLWITVDILCCNASIMCLCTISIDRYVAISHPLFYKVNSTSAKTWLAIAATWILSFILTIPHLSLAELYLELNPDEAGSASCLYYPSRWFQIYASVCFLLPLSIVVFVSGSVWRVLLSQKTRINSNLVTSGATALVESRKITSSQWFSGGKFMEFLQEKRGCIMMGIVMSVFAICWVPFFTIMLLEGVNGVLGNSFTVSVLTFDMLLWLGYFNSCVNPFIYTMFSREFRFAFKELICLRGSTLNAKIRNEAYSKQVQTSSFTTSTASAPSAATKPQQSNNSILEIK